jgi:hypothetical protein
MRRLPSLESATLKWLDNYERGRLDVHVDTSDLSQQLGVFSSVVRQLTVGMIMVGLVIGTAIAGGFLMTSQQGTGAFVPVLVGAIFAGLLLFGIWLVIRMMGASNEPS